jgi:hypothetical protein
MDRCRCERIAPGTEAFCHLGRIEPDSCGLLQRRGYPPAHPRVRSPRQGTSPRTSSNTASSSGDWEKTVSKVILQVGGSLTFAPEPDEKAQFQSDDSRQKLCEITPKPDQITFTCGTMLYDHTAIQRLDDAWAGTRLTNLAIAHAMANLVADSPPQLLSGKHQALRSEWHPALFRARQRPRPRTSGSAHPQGIFHGIGERLPRTGGGFGVDSCGEIQVKMAECWAAQSLCPSRCARC